jgi:uncharacterized protein
LFYSFPIQIKRFAPDSSGETGVFEGLASTTGRDRHGDVMERGCFSQSIEALNSGQRRIPLLLEHNLQEQIGGINTAAETDEGLYVTGQIVPGTAAADRVHALAKANAVSLSVGFVPLEHEPMADGRGHRIKRVDLMEISAVSSPANRESRILAIKNLDLASLGDFEKLFRELEIPSRLARKFAYACVDVIDKPDADELQLQAALEALKISLKP